jgi:hypothetical protein
VYSCPVKVAPWLSLFGLVTLVQSDLRRQISVISGGKELIARESVCEKKKLKLEK